MCTERIRNFCIVAHIDHGKSTLADRLLERTSAVSTRELREQFLDDMELERERGITIKASAVRMNYTFEGKDYILNLIDTPGHVDFSYEVSRSLGACEGALLLVDASQGIQAQTLANAYLAVEHNLEIVPVLSKIDLPSARPEEVRQEMETALGIKADEIILTSAKMGIGIEDVLRAIVQKIPPPGGDSGKPLRALIFDAIFNDYRGVIVYLRLFEGRIFPGMEIRMLRTGKTYRVEEVGWLSPRLKKSGELSAGEVGYLVAGIKRLSDIHIGDTVVEEAHPDIAPLPGYKEPLPMVFCGLYPAVGTDISRLRQALEKLRLNDSSFTFEPETSDALGPGFRCGFLGLLHMEIVQERLERECDVDLVQTAPNVTYEVLLRSGKTIRVDSPAKLPDAASIKEIREPILRLSVVTPSEYIGPIMKLCEGRRGTYRKTEYITPERAILTYDIPFPEVVYDFYNQLKSLTRGYGSMDYEFLGYRPAELVRLDILVSGKRVDALSTIVHRSKAPYRARRLVERLRKEIPRHLFEVRIQAAIGGRIVASESIKPLAKNVTAKCYGGDVTRKRKLLEKQKAGKKRMKNVGNVEIPQKAFMSVLKADLQ